MDCSLPGSMGFSRQEYWSGLLFPSPVDLPDLGIQATSPAWLEDLDSLPTKTQGKTGSCLYANLNALIMIRVFLICFPCKVVTSLKTGTNSLSPYSNYEHNDWHPVSAQICYCVNLRFKWPCSNLSAVTLCLKNQAQLLSLGDKAVGRQAGLWPHFELLDEPTFPFYLSHFTWSPGSCQCLKDSLSLFPWSTHLLIFTLKATTLVDFSLILLPQTKLYPQLHNSTTSLITFIICITGIEMKSFLNCKIQEKGGYVSFVAVDCCICDMRGHTQKTFAGDWNT